MGSADELDTTALHRLTEASRALSYDMSPDDVLGVTVEAAEDLLSAERVVLMLVEGEGELVIRAARGLEEGAESRFREPLDERLPVLLAKVFGRQDPEGFLAAPLVVGGRVVGLLAVLLTEPRGAPRKEWLLTALADQASVAIAAALKDVASAEQEGGRLEVTSTWGRLPSDALRIVGHDLRSPLGAMFGYLELLRMGAYGPLTKRQDSAVDRMMLAVSHVDSLVENALEMGRLQSPAVKIDLIPVDVSEVARETVGIVELQARSAGTKLDIAVPSGLKVLADPARLRQVLVQLVDNAIKHSPTGARVRVSATELDGPDGAVVIRVSDDGPGIDPGHNEEIFEPYRQLEGGVGSGLGLAIARAVTELMGGVVTLEHDNTPGATFSVRLQAAST